MNCSKCGKEPSRNKHSWCKKCLLKSTQKWKKEFYKRTTPEERTRFNKENVLRAKYSITLEQYEQMVISQASQCKICHTETPGGRTNTFVVDHDHATNVIRGLLCSNCNLALGLFKDSLSSLQNAINYLRKS